MDSQALILTLNFSGIQQANDLACRVDNKMLTFLMLQGKTIDIVAGAHGRGKKNFSESYIFKRRRSLIYLNPDIIAAGISTVDAERASLQAGRILITEVKHLISQGQSFCFETTLAGRTWFTILNKALRKGYEINIYYLYLSDV